MKLMMFIVFLVFLVVACSSDNSPLPKHEVPEVQEVLLTPQEKENLKLKTLTPQELTGFGMTAFPGYIDPRIVVKTTQLYKTADYLETVYLAEYEEEEITVGIHTLTFNSDDLGPVLDDLISQSIYQGGKYIFLRKENVVVGVVGDTNIDLQRLAEISNKLSQRLDMDIVDPYKPPAHTPEKCVFQYGFSCNNHHIGNTNIVLWVESVARKAVIIRDVTLTSKALKGGDCTTGIINKPFPSGARTAFELDKSSTQDLCYYEDLNREKNLYEITVTYKIIDDIEGTEDSDSGYAVLKGVLLARPPS